VIEASEERGKNVRKLQALRSQLRTLLAMPLPVNGSIPIAGGGSNTKKYSSKSRKEAIGSNSSVNLRKAKGRGLFVFAK
jgi:hypothetical protein